jgi:6-phosphogluconolactonase
VGTPIALDPALTPVTGVISHNGRNLYLGVGNTVAGFENGAVIHYRIGHGGVPVQQGAPVSMGLPTDGAAEPIISPDGKWLYVASYVASAIVTFAIHPDGSLSSQPVGRMDVGYGPITPIISPNGRFLYITNELNQTIRGFAIEPNGSLKPVPGSPFASGSIPHNFVFSADGKYLYSANTAGSDISGLTTGGGSISAFAVQQDGALVPLPGSPYRSLPGPITVNMSTSGQWLYVTSSPQSGADRAVELSSYKINADGTLDMSQAHSVATGQQAADGPETVVIPAQH